MQKIHHLGVCSLTGERCEITAEYRETNAFYGHRFIKERTVCSLGPCKCAADCREYNHFPAEYEL